MKLIVVTLPDVDERPVTSALVEAQFGVTRIASTGSFWRAGTSTLLIGVPDERLEDAIQIIQGNCTPPIEPGLKRVSLFVLNVERFEQL